MGIKARLRALENSIPKQPAVFIVPKIITLRGAEAARAQAERASVAARATGPVKLIQVIQPAGAGTE